MLPLLLVSYLVLCVSDEVFECLPIPSFPRAPWFLMHDFIQCGDFLMKISTDCSEDDYSFEDEYNHDNQIYIFFCKGNWRKALV